MLVLGRLLLPQLFAQAARTKNPELFLSACLLVVIVASLVTSAVGFSPILGALIAGIVIAETDYRGEVEAITAPFRGLGLGIFLITVGMGVEIDAIVQQWRSFLAALVGVLLREDGGDGGFCSGSAVLGRRSPPKPGCSWPRPPKPRWSSLRRRQRRGLISGETASFWQIVTAIGLTVTPLLARLGKLAGSAFCGSCAGLADGCDAGTARASGKW